MKTSCTKIDSPIGVGSSNSQSKGSNSPLACLTNAYETKEWVEQGSIKM